MAANLPSDSKPAGDDRNLVPVDAKTAVGFEEKLHVFWARNRAIVLAVCGLVIAAILIRGIWSYRARQKERDIKQAYAAATTTEQLKAFSAEHPDHTLGAIAQLRIADEAYAAGKSADAIAAYDKVVAGLEEGPLAARAKLGRALANVQAGNAAEGSNELKQLADDPNELKAIRTEAAYHLASLAAAAVNAADVQKYSDQLMQIDPTSPWTQRGLSLRATLPAPAAAAQSAAPAEAEKPPVQFTIPKK